MPNHRCQKRSGGTRPDGHFLAGHARSVALLAAKMAVVSDLAPSGAPWGTMAGLPFGTEAPRYVQSAIPILGNSGESRCKPLHSFPFTAGSDYYSRRCRGPVFLLLGLPAPAAQDVERNGAAAHSILALARAKTAPRLGRITRAPAACSAFASRARPLPVKFFDPTVRLGRILRPWT